MALTPASPPKSVFDVQSEIILSKLDELVRDNIIYPHQAEAVKALKKELDNPPQLPGQPEALRNVSLAVLPTGTGKTGVGVLAAYACNARKVLVITPSETISKQQLTQFTYVFNDKRLNPLERRPFLDDRRIFTEKDMGKWAPTSKCILKTSELKGALMFELVIVNAHKFGAQAKGVNLGDIDPNLFSLVIVDEAHHYPAKTWREIVEHFKSTQIIFLTATPYNSGQYILQGKRPCYELSRDEAIAKGCIRSMEFEEEETDYGNRQNNMLAVLQRMKQRLRQHDTEDNRFKHKGMILASSTSEAREIVDLWNNVVCYGSCASFVQGDTRDAVTNFEGPDGTTVLVVIFRLTEGFDCKYVSVVAILRNVQKQSRVYFAQFVGRAVRKLHPADPVKAFVISHATHNQKPNFEQFEKLAEEDPEDPQDLNDDAANA